MISLVKILKPVKIAVLAGLISGIVFIIVFHTTAGLLFNLATGTLPNSKNISRMRSALLEQQSFIALLRRHEHKALSRYSSGGKSIYLKKYVHKTSTGMLGLRMFEDYWEVWVLTAVRNTAPYTSFLVRLGMVKDTNAVSFFSDQSKTGFGKWFWKNVVVCYNYLFDAGVFKPVRFNITESDATSSISRKRLSVDEWKQKTIKMVRNGT